MKKNPENFTSSRKGWKIPKYGWKKGWKHGVKMADYDNEIENTQMSKKPKIQ